MDLVVEAEIGGVDLLAILGLDVDRGRARLVEGDLQVVAAQQVDAVEGSVVRELVELVTQIVVLAGQIGADRVAVDLGGRADAIGRAGGADAVDREFLRGLVLDAQLAVVVRGADLAVVPTPIAVVMVASSVETVKFLPSAFS